MRSSLFSKTSWLIGLGVAIGILPIPLGVAVPVLVPVVDALMSPGVLLTLPFHNLMPGVWSLLGLVGLANGVVYGAIGWGIGWALRLR